MRLSRLAIPVLVAAIAAAACGTDPADNPTTGAPTADGSPVAAATGSGDLEALLDEMRAQGVTDERCDRLSGFLGLGDVIASSTNACSYRAGGDGTSGITVSLVPRDHYENGLASSTAHAVCDEGYQDDQGTQFIVAGWDTDLNVAFLVALQGIENPLARGTELLQQLC